MASSSRPERQEVQAFILSLLEIDERTDADIALAAGVAASELSKWKTGKHMPNGAHLLALMRAVGYVPSSPSERGGLDQVPSPERLELLLRRLEVRIAELEEQARASQGESQAPRIVRQNVPTAQP